MSNEAFNELRERISDGSIRIGVVKDRGESYYRWKARHDKLAFIKYVFAGSLGWVLLILAIVLILLRRFLLGIVLLVIWYFVASSLRRAVINSDIRQEAISHPSIFTRLYSEGIITLKSRKTQRTVMYPHLWTEILED